jgi:hypothetical protein
LTHNRCSYPCLPDAIRSRRGDGRSNQKTRFNTATSSEELFETTARKDSVNHLRMIRKQTPDGAS